LPILIAQAGDRQIGIEMQIQASGSIGLKVPTIISNNVDHPVFSYANIRKAEKMLI